MSVGTDAELYGELLAGTKAVSRQLLRDPMTLARGLDGLFVNRAHLRVLSRAYARIEAGELDRVQISTPPQVGKSSLSEWAVFWWLCLHPTHRVIIASYSASQAIKRGRKVRALIRQYGAEYGLFLDPENSAVDDYALTSGGGVKSAGFGGSITGSPGDMVVIDDPHKNRAEARSTRMRESVWSSYSADLLSRLAPDAPMILIQTRWDPDDLAGKVVAQEGRVEDGGRWLVINMPALCTDPATDPLGRAMGEPLPHPKIDPNDKAKARRHWEGRRAGTSVQDWFALYQGEPRPVEGALVTRELMRDRRHYRSGVRPVRIGVAVDPSGGGRDSAGIVGGHLGDDGRLYLTHDRTAPMSTYEWSREACRLAAEIKAQVFYVEWNFGRDQATLALHTAWDALRREWDKARAALSPAELERIKSIPAAEQTLEQRPTNPFSELRPYIDPVNAKLGKVLRAEPIAQQWREDRIRTGKYLPELEDEWSTWQPGGESPGRIDASVYLAYKFLRVPGSGEAFSSPAEVSISQVEAGGGWTAARIERGWLPGP
ncbi:terminase large subunit domain-containing protein [Streptacidiphilus cavernicola]|uniref:Terminase large subunit domain-containing protein n=1 Tax=Streptacidiphilus cavernicola TaxID=3342716 RepID=A0ABV6VYZ0_9ACTN